MYDRDPNALIGNKVHEDLPSLDLSQSKLSDDKRDGNTHTIVVVKSSPRQSILYNIHGFGHIPGLLPSNVSIEIEFVEKYSIGVFNPQDPFPS